MFYIYPGSVNHNVNYNYLIIELSHILYNVQQHYQGYRFTFVYFIVIVIV